MTAVSPGKGAPLYEYLLRLADDRLVLGHRLSEWCGHAPILEEDIALANIALDLIGQATLFLKLAAEAGEASGERPGSTEDTLAYLREAIEYRNLLLVELPKGDFAFTIVRQFLFGVFALMQMDAMQRGAHRELAGIAAKAAKETRYHVRHAGDWLLRLGDGTDDSHRRAQQALNDQWRYTGELFFADGVDDALVREGIAANLEKIEPAWRQQVSDVVSRATLLLPPDGYMQRGGREGRHTEHLGHLLAEMQIVARSFPGAAW